MIHQNLAYCSRKSSSWAVLITKELLMCFLISLVSSGVCVCQNWVFLKILKCYRNVTNQSNCKCAKSVLSPPLSTNRAQESKALLECIGKLSVLCETSTALIWNHRTWVPVLSKDQCFIALQPPFKLKSHLATLWEATICLLDQDETAAAQMQNSEQNWWVRYWCLSCKVKLVFNLQRHSCTLRTRLEAAHLQLL